MAGLRDIGDLGDNDSEDDEDEEDGYADDDGFEDKEGEGEDYEFWYISDAFYFFLHLNQV